jgi:hypothetical protein
MLKGLLLIILTFLGEAYGQRSCFSQHIQESIEINHQVKKLYAKLSQNQSNGLFRFLITSEKLALPAAKFYDRQALIYHQHGIDLFCQEFAPMKTPNGPIPLGIPGTISPQELPWKSYRSQLKAALKTQEPELVMKQALKAIQELKPYLGRFCFTRHLLESIFRIAYFVDNRSHAAQSLNLPHPKKLMFRVMKYHLLGFYGAHRLDQMALGLQEKGIPVLCHELPDLLEDLDLGKGSYGQN